MSVVKGEKGNAELENHGLPYTEHNVRLVSDWLWEFFDGDLAEYVERATKDMDEGTWGKPDR